MLTGPILLFDGVCNLCKSSVQFVIARDPNARFRFASLQSEIGAALARHFGINADQLTSVVLIADGQAHTHSSGALRSAKLLRQPWPLMAVFLVIPRFIRDWVYDFIGNRRYRWFGKMEVCWMPEPALQSRFLDQPSNNSTETAQ